MPVCTRTPEENKKLCDGCSLCCEYIMIDIKEPKTRDDADCIVWYLLHESYIYVDMDGAWFVEIPRKCSALNDKKECSVYHSRPNICRNYTQEDCEKYGTGKYFKHIFKSVDEFLEFTNSELKL